MAWPQVPNQLQEIDDSLTHLRLLGVFDEIAGLIFGKVNDHSAEEDEVLTELIQQHTHPYEFPVLFGVDIGHTDPKLILSIGVTATLDSDSAPLRFNEAAIE